MELLSVNINEINKDIHNQFLFIDCKMMKKSQTITLILITAALASCNKPQKKDPKEWTGSNVYMRSDTTASYSHVNHSNAILWYLAFRPYGSYYGGSYHHAGYYSNGISPRSNIGTSSVKTGIVRGGFGSGGRSFSVSS